MFKWIEKTLGLEKRPRDITLRAPIDRQSGQASFAEFGGKIIAGIRAEFETELDFAYKRQKDAPYKYITERLECFDDEIAITFFARIGTDGQNTISIATGRAGTCRCFPCFGVFGKTHSEGGERTPSYEIMPLVEQATRRYIANIAESHFDAGTSDDEVYARDYGVSVTLEVLGSSAQIIFSEIGMMGTIQDSAKDALRRYIYTPNGGINERF